MCLSSDNNAASSSQIFVKPVINVVYYRLPGQ